MRNLVKLPLLLAVLMLGVALAGCETLGPTGVGAATGAVAGGVIGNQQGKTLEGAAIGGVVGGAGGYLIDKADENE